MERLELEQLFKYAIPHSLTASDCGKLALIVSRPCRETDGYDHGLYVLDRGRDIVRLRTPGNIRWYLWDNEFILIPSGYEGGKTFLAELDPADGSVVRELPAVPLAVKSMKRISGSWYAASAQIESGDPDAFLRSEEEKNALSESMKYESDCEIIEELPFWVDGGSYTSRKRTALFVFNISTGECRRITGPLFQSASFCSIDGILYYSGEEYADKASLTNDIWRYDPVTGLNTCIYCGHEYNMGNGGATDGGGIFAWNGRLMLLASKNTFYDRRLHKSFYTVDKISGEISLFCDYPFCPTCILVTDLFYGGAEAFVADGDRLYFRSTVDNECRLMAMDGCGRVTVACSCGGSITGAAAAGGRVYCTALKDQSLPELYLLKDDGSPECISSFNKGVLDGYYIAAPRHFTFESHGRMIDGFVMYPKDYDPSGSYPGILTIHGGPNAAFGTVFYHETQYWAGRGYFVFYCNPEGSEGYGDDFLNISGRLGKEDYESFMRFTDIVLERYPAMDRNRLCVTGGSYGGFMTNWIVGHTDRFACAASQRSISNFLTLQTICDIGYHFTKDLTRGSLERDPEKMWEQSPLKYAASVRTPILFLHSDADHRCPIDQALQMFGLLKDLGVETRLCIFHGEPHGLNRSGKPSNRIRRIREITDWFDKYTGV